MTSKKFNAIIAGGGTGGHLYPAIAIGEEIKYRAPNVNIHYVGSIYGIEKQVLPILNENYSLLPIKGLQRGLSFSSLRKNIILPPLLLKSIVKIKSIFKSFKPDIVIGTGGYASAIPIKEGLKRNIPIFLQEQNSYPGITTRFFAKRADKVCVAFKEVQDKIKTKCIITGNPVRKVIGKANRIKSLEKFKLNPKYKTIFVFGGSQGSLPLNNFIKKHSKEFVNNNIQVLWQTGEREFEKYKNLKNNFLKIKPYISDMASAYASSDLIISRSGALTCSEITICNKPSILIPLPFSAGNHQLKNAKALNRAGACEILLEKELSNFNSIHKIIQILRNKKKLELMQKNCKKISKPEATMKIVDQIMMLIK